MRVWAVRLRIPATLVACACCFGRSGASYPLAQSCSVQMYLEAGKAYALSTQSAHLRQRATTRGSLQLDATGIHSSYQARHLLALTIEVSSPPSACALLSDIPACSSAREHPLCTHDYAAPWSWVLDASSWC